MPATVGGLCRDANDHDQDPGANEANDRNEDANGGTNGAGMGKDAGETGL